MSENNRTTRRKFLEGVSAAVGVVGFNIHSARAKAPDGSITATSDPQETKTNNDGFTMCGPDQCGSYQGDEHTWFNHRGTIEYWGIAPRPEPTGTDKWGHIFRISGRGETVSAYGGDDPKESGEYNPYLTGHGIDFHDWNSNTTLWDPGVSQHQGKLGASPAEDNRMMDSTERAENILQVLLEQTPGLGTVSDLGTIVNNLVVSSGSGNDTFGWSLDSISGIDYEHTSTTDHFIEFEARAEPGDNVEGQVDTKSYLTYKVEAESPLGQRGFATLETTDDPVPENTQEALDYGYDIKLNPSATDKYQDQMETSGEVKVSDVDVQDIIAPPGGSGSYSIDFVNLP